MQRSIPSFVWAWRGRLVGVLLIAGVVTTPILAAEALFPQPLHFVRQIDDPIAATSITLHEYCAGDRVVTVNGSRVAIADYAKQTLTEIDRATATYSITRFDELAAAQAELAPKASVEKWTSTPLGVRGAQSGRSVDAFELTSDDRGDAPKIQLGLDRSVIVSRAALDVLLGAAWPHPRRGEHEAMARAAARRERVASQSETAGRETFALPVEQTMTFEVAGERLVLRNAIVEIRNDLVPDDVQRIPPGATLVESRTTRAARELRELDRLPSQTQR